MGAPSPFGFSFNGYCKGLLFWVDLYVERMNYGSTREEMLTIRVGQIGNA